MLVECLQTQSMDVDSVIYPLVMNYRHGVEGHAQAFSGNDLVPLCWGVGDLLQHKLVDNWGIVISHLPEIDVPQDDITEPRQR